MTNPIEKEPMWCVCPGCREEWTKQSMNEYGYCPDCHNNKFNGGLSKNRLWQLTIHNYWNDHLDLVCQSPSDMPKKIKETLYSLIKFEYKPTEKKKSMRDEINE